MRLCGIVVGSIAGAFACWIGLAAAAAVATAATKGVAGGVVGFTFMAALLLGVAGVAAKTGH